MRRYEITIPPTTIGQLRHPDFQWTFTLSENVAKESRVQYSSKERYKIFTYIEVDDVYCQTILFDFIRGRLIIETNERDRQKVLNILKYLTVHSSSKSQAFFINPKKSDEVL